MTCTNAQFILHIFPRDWHSQNRRTDLSRKWRSHQFLVPIFLPETWNKSLTKVTSRERSIGFRCICSYWVWTHLSAQMFTRHNPPLDFGKYSIPNKKDKACFLDLPQLVGKPKYFASSAITLPIPPRISSLISPGVLGVKRNLWFVEVDGFTWSSSKSLPNLF